MKKLLILFSLGLFLLGFNQEANASHLAGGEITYSFAGTTQNPYRYDVVLTLYRRVQGITLPANANITVTSSCGSDINVQVSTNNPGGANNVPTVGFDPCILDNQPGYAGVEITTYRYTGFVDLHGPCSDYAFEYYTCCRNGNITNGPSNAGFFIESTLNNTRGENDSPVFLNAATKSFCSSSAHPFLWSHAATEPDGTDSIIFTLAQPWSQKNTPIPWAPGFSTQVPMTVHKDALGQDIFSLNPKTGTLYFHPSTPEVDVLKIVIVEYRFDNAFQAWYQIGTTIRELQVPLMPQCAPSSNNAVSTDTTVTDPVTGKPAGTSLYTTDSIRNTFNVPIVANPDSSLNNNGDYAVRLDVIPYRCLDSTVTIKFDYALVCDSFSDDASEFRIIGPDGVSRPPVAVNTKCQADLLTKEVDITLHRALDTIGDYLLYIKTGTDGNTLVNECGAPLPAQYCLIIRVDTCIDPVYDLSNVSVYADHAVDINWEMDPTTFTPSAFDGWHVLRANQNDQFYKVAAIDDANAINVRSYRDTSLDPINLDQSKYQYRIQPVINGKAKAPSRRIYTILLEDTIIEEGVTVNYNWSEYDGWANGAYEFHFGYYDSLISDMSWTTMYGPTVGYRDQDMGWPDCDANRDTAGLYAVRVVCSDPANPSNSFTSMSNWIYFEVLCDKPEPKPDIYVKIPNVFTPNGDNENDLFFVETAGYTDVNIAVFNRWGKPVFEESGLVTELKWDGSDQNSGTTVADGVYYYVITVSGDIDDGLGGIEHINEEKTGSLTIFAGANK